MVTNIDRLDVLAGMSRQMDLVQIREMIECIRETAQQLKLNANARLALEVMMLGIPDLRQRVDKARPG
jgi:DNA polymerase III gamma/tau subunit